MKSFLRTIIVFIITLEARLILKKYQPRIIAITGSVGKTSAKDAIYTALGGGSNLRKNEKSLNSEIGVPLTIIGAQNAWESVTGWINVIGKGLRTILFQASYPQTLIVEVGADHPGDIQKIALWLKPDVAVITGIPDLPSHITFFDSAEEVFKEKAMLARYLKPNGTLIFNYDDVRARALAHDHKNVITYGIIGGLVTATDIATVLAGEQKPTGISFRVNHADASVLCKVVGGIGDAHALAVLAGLAVGTSQGKSLSDMARSFNEYEPAPGRMRILDGLNNSTIIDDSYNSSPAAAILALDTISKLSVSGRRIVALGDMRELGDRSKEAHEMVGKRAAKVADLVITVGEESRVLADVAKNAGINVKSYEYGESEKAGKDVAQELRAGDVVLVKGSQNMIRMERFVKAIMAEPWRAEDLLVRQEAEWGTRL
jgi:UDP-N-acetylmuramoyl-tripeptide--D-alanyl-D-alanine ligase